MRTESALKFKCDWLSVTANSQCEKRTHFHAQEWGQPDGRRTRLSHSLCSDYEWWLRGRFIGAPRPIDGRHVKLPPNALLRHTQPLLWLWWPSKSSIKSPFPIWFDYRTTHEVSAVERRVHTRARLILPSCSDTLGWTFLHSRGSNMHSPCMAFNVRFKFQIMLY